MPGSLPKITIIFFLISMMLYLLLLPFIQYPINTLLKPVPILFLIVMSLQSKTSRQTKVLLCAALGFSLLGDIMLTLPGQEAFQAGIGLFMLAHCAYITLYFKDSQFQLKRFIYFLPVFVLIAISYYYLLPYFGKMAIPVTVYLCLLSFMVFSSFYVRQYPLLIISGACLFLLSDFIFALNQFVLPTNKLAGFLVMLSYYSAQFLLTAGLSQRGQGYYFINKQHIETSVNFSTLNNR